MFQKFPVQRSLRHIFVGDKTSCFDSDNFPPRCQRNGLRAKVAACGSEWAAKQGFSAADPLLSSLLTAKPRLVVLNVNMDAAGTGNEKTARMIEHLGTAPYIIVRRCVDIRDYYILAL